MSGGGEGGQAARDSDVLEPELWGLDPVYWT